MPRLLLLLSAVLALPVWGQTARELFEEGSALYAKGKFADAARKFDASYAARPVPVTKFNAARSWEQAGQALEAIDAWQAWLLVSPGAPERPEVERSLATLGVKLAALGVQALTITSLPPGARVKLDGAEAGVTPLTVELTPTRHLLRLDLEGRVPAERTLETTLDRPAVTSFELPSVEQTTLRSPTAPVTQPRPLAAPLQPRPTDDGFRRALGADAVEVHIETTHPEVRLQRVGGNPNGECRAPCDVPVARATERFFVTGSDLLPSGTFVLGDHALGGLVSLRVDGAGLWHVPVGILLATVGLASLIGGGAFFFLSDEKTLPAVVMGVGVVTAIGSIVTFATSGTDVTFGDD